MKGNEVLVDALETNQQVDTENANHQFGKNLNYEPFL
jgi:hypothetical protein